ncbi:MAG: hypothetical protein IPG74_14380 [Flavobacteriales bacterium]|nr:hypothetical protein [Flavobacteriales bacterium]
MLLVDFISYHPYEYEPDQVRNELRWYHNTIEVPWIIGETAIPADNDSVPYAEQRAFAEEDLVTEPCVRRHRLFVVAVSRCEMGPVPRRLHGVLNRDSVTRTASGALVNGTVKPVAEAIEVRPMGRSR